MTFPAYISHSLPGRLRIKVPSKVGDAQYFANVQNSLSELQDVSNIRVNHLTGSILLNHNEIKLQHIQVYASEKQLFIIERHDLIKQPVVDRFATGVGVFDKQLRGITDNSVDVRTIVFAGMLGMAAWQLQKGQVLAPATSLFWYAYQFLTTPKSS